MKYDSYEDSELWKLIAMGNQEVFAETYKRYSKDLYKYGHKFTQDTELIEDAIQDVYVHIWESRKNLIIQKSIKFYLLSAFRRELLKRIKQSRKNQSLEGYPADVAWQESFQEILIENQISLESSQKITSALDNLSMRQKEAIFLRYIQELSYDEISELMRIQVPSLYNLIFKGLKAMKDFLSSTDYTSKIVLLLMTLVN
jgi:RNA polymerase sigma factor (sigma-70 family)